jgi:ferredoxin
MTSESLKLNRRQFMLAGSAAIAAPLIMNAISKVTTVEGAEKKLTYYINNNCIGCHYCFYECPQSAIHWGDDKYEIDQTKCIQCGTCEGVCNISAATHK